MYSLKYFISILFMVTLASNARAADPKAVSIIGGQLDDVSTTAAVEDAYSPWRITAQRAGHVNLRNNAGNEVGTSGAPLRIDPTGTTPQPSTQSGTWTTGRTWTLSNGTDSIAAVQSGAWTTGRTWTLASGTDSTTAVQGTAAALSGAWPVKVTDGTTAAAVKAASTAPIATDPAMVVVESPNGNHATAANQATEITALQLIDDLPTAEGGTIVKGGPIMGQLDDTSTTAAVEDKASVVRITAQRALHTNLRNNAGTEVGTSGAPLRIDPTGTTPQPATQSGTWTTGRTWTLASGTDSATVVQGTAAALSGYWPVRVTDGTNSMPTMDVVGRAGFQKITDGTNTAAVKAASTAPIATDQALVVVQSPNGTHATAALQTAGNASLTAIDAGIPAALGQTTMSASMPVVLPSDQIVMVATSDTAPATQNITALDVGTTPLTGANGQVFYFGTPTANSAATFALGSIATVDLQADILGAGGTMVVEVSMNGGTAWFRPNVHQISTQNHTNSFTAPWAGTLNVAGFTHVRVRSTTSWSGTATITAKESLNPHVVVVGEALPTGANVIGGVTQSGTWTAGRTWTISSGTDSATVVQGTAAASSGAWPIKITDGTNNAAVKAASTAPIATDPAAVVGLSPNGNQATAANQSTEITALQIIDNLPHANDSALINGVPMMGQLDDTTPTTVTENNVSTVRITAARAEHVNLRNNAGTEIGVTGSPLIVNASAVDGSKTTYSATISNLVTAALATDFFTITGSGTKTVRITHMEVWAIGSAGADPTINLIKRSAANTAGTSSTLTDVPMDSTNAAGTATVRAYTVSPTVLGTAVGTVRAGKIFASGTSTAGSLPLIWDFGNRPAQTIVLRGTSELLCLNLGGVTITGASVNVSVEWTEE